MGSLISFATSYPCKSQFLENTNILIKKIRDTKGIFHAKMGTIKDRNDKDLTVAKGI